MFFERQSAFNKILFLLVQEVCELPLMPGSCFAAFPRVYFDSSDGQCKDFTYGGCAGNANNFRNKEECEELCGGISYTMLHVLLIMYTKCRSIHINLFYFRRRHDGRTWAKPPVTFDRKENNYHIKLKNLSKFTIF